MGVPLDLHLRHLARLGHLPGSIAVRRRILASLGPKLLSATREEIEDFLDARDLGSRTRYQYLSHLHCFYAWAIGEGFLTEDPTVKIQRPKLRRSLPRPAAAEELRRAIAQATPRLRCWISLAALEGFRCQEIAGLRAEDVLDADGLLRVSHGKGGTERLLPLHPDVAACLYALPMPRSGYVFRSPAGGRFSPPNLSHTFNRELRDLGVRATAHQLRHFFGTAVYRNTKDLRLTQELLGHQSVQTTAVYTAFSPEQARSAIADLRL